MAQQVERIQVQSSPYEIGASSDATFTGTSYDASDPVSWAIVDILGTNETYGSIFTKISSMFRNIRYLYKQLGDSDYKTEIGATTLSAALLALQNNKANKQHSHTAADLPISNVQVASTEMIPTSDLVNSMNNTINSLSTGKYEKPTTGIPYTDLATYVQLGIDKHWTFVLPTSGWSSAFPYTQTIAVSGMKTSYKPQWGVKSDADTDQGVKDLKKMGAYVYKIVTSEEQITAYAYKKPTLDLTVEGNGV